MKRKTTAGIIASAALLGTALTGGAATAATPTAAHATAAAGTATAASCVYAEAKESVKIRNAKKVSATALGLLPKGKKACITGPSATGGSYTLCGEHSSYWMQVSYSGIKGWIPMMCTVNHGEI
ncbi:hypothetical protein ACH4Q6_19865 [Streptomyces lydicus]|uniref:hypothetical protein n=1 Tax=Streptomyces lydicus TaxID=47763 RepID=UPI0037881366